jgi:hypothetical protein
VAELDNLLHMTFDKITFTRSGATALIVTMIFITGITILADLIIPVKTWLASTYGHHWVGKGILSVVLFIVLTALSYPLMKRNVCNLSPKVVLLSAYLAIFGSFAMTFFFMYEYFKAH